ncbi:MAG TPA: hypothetical protein VG694_02710 [Candidatus Paceibacterota bacterium]|jgi:hypothetical protein|nr:hypothetical protein [Candidatus Paceibacterota bacterium]
MGIENYINKENLHHAYLIEGTAESVFPELEALLNKIKFKTSGNPDFVRIIVDSFKIDDARNLKAMASERGLTEGKRIFFVFANSFQSEAQNALLKMFEEPAAETHYFLVTPNASVILPTLLSRLYIVRDAGIGQGYSEEAKKFLQMPLSARIEYLKDFLKNVEDEDTGGSVDNFIRAKSLRFLNALEALLHEKFFKDSKTRAGNPDFFSDIFKSREFIRQPGSSVKNLLEAVALSVPEK